MIKCVFTFFRLPEDKDSEDIMSTKGISEVPVFVDGVQKWVTGLTPKTTCDDVIHSLLINMGCPTPHEAVFDYALFENWRGIERPLKGRSKFIKLCKDWGGEGCNVELTMRKIDSTIRNDICGTLKKKQKKSWFKFRDSGKEKQMPLARSMHDVNTAENITSIHEDSSLMMQNKENLFCAFRCYSKKKSQRGLKERSSNLRTPFERPRSVAVVAPQERPRSVVMGNPTYTDAITCIYSSKDKSLSPPNSNEVHTHYSSTTSLKKTNSVYGSTATLRQIDTMYKRQSLAVPEQNYEPLYSTARDIYPRGEHLYDYPKSRVVGRRATQNPVDWDYDYDKHIDYYGESDSGESDQEEDIYGHADSKLYSDNRFKSILNLVLSQERKIQEQFDRIKLADKQIEAYEIKMHNVRASEQGKDYLQETYLKGEQLLAAELPEHEINAYESIVQSMAKMDSQLSEQYNKIEDLSTMLHNESHMDVTLENGSAVTGPLESTRIDPNVQKQIDELKERLSEFATRTSVQDREIKEIDHYLSTYEQQLMVKQKELETMIKDIENEPVTPVNPPCVPSRESPNPRDCPSVLPSLSNELRQSENAIRDILSSVTKKPQQTKCNSTSSLPSTSVSTHVHSERKSCSTSALPRPHFFKEEADHSQPFHEMGIDVGSSSSVCLQGENMPDKQCDKEIESILQCKRAPTPGTVVLRSRDNTPRFYRNRDTTPRLCKSRENTPLGTLSRDGTPLGTSVNAIVDYHNETVDLDSICNFARRQKAAKQQCEGFRPIQSCSNSVQSVNNVTDDHKDFQSAIHASFSSSASTSNTPLPPVGMESVAKAFSQKLMPDFTSDPHDNSNNKCDSAPDTTINNNSCNNTCNNVKDTLSHTHFNETSVWASQDDGIDVTFTVPHGPVMHNDTIDQTEDTFFISQNKSNTLLESHYNTTVDCDNTADQSSFVSTKPPRPQNQQKQPPKVKKRLFEEPTSRYQTEAVYKEINNIMCSLTGDVSGNCSRLSDSSESGVGSLHDSHESNDSSAVSWTSTCSTTSTRSIETTV